MSMPLTAIQCSGGNASSQCPTQRMQMPPSIAGSASDQLTLRPDISILGALHPTTTSDQEGEALPALPSSDRAKELVDTVYFYTQARYCIVDWIQLREWHHARDVIAYTSTEGPVSSQTGKQAWNWGYLDAANILLGAFFIWIIYAIGACLVPNSENSTEVSRHCLPA